MTSESGPGPFRLVRVAWDDPRAVALRQSMDLELVARYTTPDSPELQPGALAALAVDPADVRATVLVLDADATPIAHGAIRMLGGEWEVKRVIVAGDQRGRGVGRAVMVELEGLAWAGGARRVILQTGDRQPEAVALYRRLGYTPIPIYEPYVEAIPFSRCFEKISPGLLP